MQIGAMCKSFHILPKAGGLLDQDPIMVLALAAMLAAQSEKQEQEQGKAEAKARLSKQTQAGRR